MHAHRHTTGRGHLYQGIFKSFPVRMMHLLHGMSLCRTERFASEPRGAPRLAVGQPLSLAAWECEQHLLAAWPLRRLAGWVDEVNAPQTEAELADCARGQSRLSLRRHRVVRPGCCPAGSGEHASPPRQAQETGKRFLTPFLPHLFFLLTPFLPGDRANCRSHRRDGGRDGLGDAVEGFAIEEARPRPLEARRSLKHRHGSKHR